jgi:hypothetical protein
MINRRHGLLGVVGTLVVALLASTTVGALELALDAKVEVGAKKPQDRQYSVVIGKETTIEKNEVYRVVVTPVMQSPHTVFLTFQMLNTATNKVMAGGTKVIPLGKKDTMFHVGELGSPDRFKLDALLRVK